MKYLSHIALVLTVGVGPSSADAAERILRAALYPYIPARAEAYWMLEQRFEAANPDVDLVFVDLAGDYYGGQLKEALADGTVDVVEVDTVLLEELVRARLLDSLDGLPIRDGDYLPVAAKAAHLPETEGSGERVRYGVPHWVCGNFLFFRDDDPERDRLTTVRTLADLEAVVGGTHGEGHGLFVDLRGSSTLGEKYLDALYDIYGPDQALELVEAIDTEKLKAAKDPIGLLDAQGVRSLDRLFRMCPGGLCDSDKHHEFGQYYGRAFASRDVRLLVGYSEHMYSVTDEFLHGVEDGRPAVGGIRYDWKDDDVVPVGEPAVDVIPAPMGEGEGALLAWVDVLSVRRGLDRKTRKDAEALVLFVESEEAVRNLLVPAWGEPPRYLLPARSSLYDDAAVKVAAPLYPKFLTYMQGAETASGRELNDQLRAIGKALEKRPFQPYQD